MNKKNHLEYFQDDVTHFPLSLKIKAIDIKTICKLSKSIHLQNVFFCVNKLVKCKDANVRKAIERNPFYILTVYERIRTNYLVTQSNAVILAEVETCLTC